ncbi:cytochrome P450 [Zopfia rhizophila CBS 207.26]|uniref:Cytochrome P450 n=1 Tax=Zopfia rhizophila CBS 207.26 TaxID=1314779 RepID=A0A6A6DEV2_9PEZI|nr:cytochrome P450 [Zopfia rhizophila CBS 207.26]
MDLAACAGASVLKIAAFTPRNQLLTVNALKLFLAFFLAQYAAFKVYRFFIVPFFQSPLRHLSDRTQGKDNHHFLLGQTLNQFKSGSSNEPLLSWMRHNSEALLVTSMAAHKEILQAKCYSFVKPDFYARLITDIVGRGIVFAEGDEHKTMRKLIAGMQKKPERPPFAVNNLKRLIPIFHQKTRELSGVFDLDIATESGVVELVSTYSMITLDIIGVFALGVELKNLSATTPFHENYYKVFNQDTLSQIITAINAYLPLRKWLPVEANRSFQQANAELCQRLLKIVRQRIVDIPNGDFIGVESGGMVTKDLLTYMVEESVLGQSPGKVWTEEHVLGQNFGGITCCLGHETMASSLIWATRVLSIYPDVQGRLRCEVLALVEQNPNLDYAAIESLRFLNNFCREILRVQCPDKMILPSGYLRQDLLTLTAAYSYFSSPTSSSRCSGRWGPHPARNDSHHDAGDDTLQSPYMGEDADKFDLDRWGRLSGEAADAHAFAAFMLDPRMCIGKVFTMFEFKAILIEIMSKFTFEPTNREKIVLVNPSPLLRPRGGLRVRVKRLVKAARR